MGNTWDTDDLSSILMSISGEPVTNFGLGHSMGIADTRHFLIGIMRKHLRGIASVTDLLEEYFNAQSGHSEDVAEKYAISFDTIQCVSIDHLARFVAISKAQHDLVLPRCTSGTDSESFTVMPGHHDNSHAFGGLQIDIGQLSEAIAPQIATLLIPLIQQQIADGFASITPMGNTSRQRDTAQSRSASE